MKTNQELQKIYGDQMDLELARELALQVLRSKRARGWTEERLQRIEHEGGPTQCRRGFYLITRGAICTGPRYMTKITDANGVGSIQAIRGLLSGKPGLCIGTSPPNDDLQLELFA